jgi:hypothetical protein
MIPWYKRGPYRTFTFYFCVSGVAFDSLIAVVFSAIPFLRPWVPQFLLCACLFAIGAISHWLLERLMRPKR